MTLQPLRDRLSTTTWGAHSRYKNKVLKSFEWFFLIQAVIPALMVHELSDQLDWRHREELFFQRHVEVINKHDELFADWRPVNTLSMLVKFAVHKVLDLVGRGLGREGHLESLVFFRHLIEAQLIDIDRLSRSDWTRHKNVLSIKDQHLGKSLHSD